MIILEKGIEESIPSCTRYPLMVMYAARKLTGLALKAKVRLHIVDLRCRYLKGGGFKVFLKSDLTMHVECFNKPLNETPFYFK